jgi:hypothetical protein
MVMDGAKSQVEGEFRRKMCDAVCHIKQTDPHIQSSNMGEGRVLELKRGVGSQMLRSACPNQLWDDGLEGQVPESKVKGETVDIATITEYDWYEWVKFLNTAAKFPVSKIQLGIYLGATIDIGPGMARKILKNNGQVIYMTSVRSLTPHEMKSPSERKEHE